MTIYEERVTKILNEWLEENHFSARVRGADSDFYWYPNSDEISFSLLVDENSNKEWEKFLEELNCHYIMDPFYTSFLHEVFHSETYHLLDEDEINYSNDIKFAMHEDPDGFSNIYQDYFHLPDEIIASKEAVKFINKNPTKVIDLISRVSPVIEYFYSTLKEE